MAATARRWVRRTILAGVATAVLMAPRLAPGTVAEQRARLPPPAVCVSPVEGVWKAHRWVEHQRNWYEFTLEMRFAEGQGSKLVGKIYTHSWDGEREDESPPPCAEQLHYKLSMEAAGRYADGQVEFGGLSYQLDEVFCGSIEGFGYNLDQFSGRIDPELQEFQSVNNDGGELVNDPTVFRRIRCFDDERPGRVSVTPPPFQPPSAQTQRSSGCGLAWGVR